MCFLNSGGCQARQVQYQFYRIYRPRINFLFTYFYLLSLQVIPLTWYLRANRNQKARVENGDVINGIGGCAHFFPFSPVIAHQNYLSLLVKTLDFVSPKTFKFFMHVALQNMELNDVFKTDWLTPVSKRTDNFRCMYKLQCNSRRETSRLMMRFPDELPRDQIWTQFSNWSQVSSVAFTRHVREKPLASR